MERLMEILKEIDDTVDYGREKALIDNGIWDSFAVITLIGELEEAFGVRIAPAQIVPRNFNSAEAIWDMVRKLQEA